MLMVMGLASCCCACAMNPSSEVFRHGQIENGGSGAVGMSDFEYEVCSTEPGEHSRGHLEPSKVAFA